MSAGYRQGGVPRVLRTSIDTTGREVPVGRAINDPKVGVYKFTSQYLQITNTDANACRIYFLEEDFSEDEHYIELAASGGVWEGPAELVRFWAKSQVGASVLQIVAFQRLG
jgi:hypothetical protein